MKNKSTYQNLLTHRTYFDNTSLDDLFKNHPERADDFFLTIGEIYLDYSKNHINAESMKLLFEFAKEQNIQQKINDLFSGKIVNLSENRPALHTALRAKQDHGIILNNYNIHDEVNKTRQRMLRFAKKLNSGEVKGCTGKPVKHFIVLGIGGSYLGPEFVIDALKPFHSSPITITFIANIDESELEQSLQNLDLDECLFFIASKSFTTLETLTNAQSIQQRFMDNGYNKQDFQYHFLAASSNTQAALEFGITPENIYPLWDWVGGRFSLWSSIGLPILIAVGEQNYQNFLNGAFEMDEHFLNSPLHQNMPLTLALLSFWYQQFFGVSSHALIPYAHNLKTFPTFLQQLDMESLGKSLSSKGEVLDYPTGAIIWGSEGTNSQHSFHQLLHQGSHLIPVDFMVSLKPDYPANKNHALLYAQCLAQSRALMLGNKTLKAEQQCTGNKPSNTLVLNSINPHSVGALIALYEHKVFAQSILLNINAFDQWGVELGKKTGKEITQALQNQKYTGFDASTNNLLKLLNP